MNWFVLVIIIIITIIASVFEYRRSRDYKAVIVLVSGITISILCGLGTPDISFGLDSRYEQYYEKTRIEITNAIQNREYDLALDYLKQLADETESVYGETSLESGVIYAEIGQVYNFLSDTINADKYVGLAKEILLNYTPTNENYIKIAQIYQACGMAEENITDIKFFYNRALAVLSEFNDTSSMQAASVYANYANAYTQVDDYVSALEYAEKAKNLFEKKLGTTSREAGIAYCALGNIYSMRNYTEAMKYYNKASDIFRNNAPDDDSFLAVCYSGMASLYLKTDIEKCYQYAYEAWNINKSVYGEMHMNTISSEIDMAVYYRSNGDIEEARSFLDDACTKAQEKYNNSSLLATIYVELGNLEQELQNSLNYYNKAEHILRYLYGEQHLDIAYIYINESIVYYSNNDSYNAKKYYEKAVAIYENKNGNYTPEYAELIEYGGTICHNEDNYVAAIKQYEEAKRIFDILYGEVNANSARCEYEIAGEYSLMGETELADRLFLQSISVCEMIFGKYSVENSELYCEYAKHIYGSGQDIDQAIEYAQKAVDITGKSGQKNTVKQMQYCYILGNLYTEIDDREDGIKYLKECVRIAEYNGVVNPDYVQALCMIAQQYSIPPADEDSSIWYIEQAVYAANKAGGHIDLCAAYYHTSIAWGNMGYYSKALDYLDLAEQESLLIDDQMENNFDELIKEYREHVIKCSKM